MGLSESALSAHAGMFVSILRVNTVEFCFSSYFVSSPGAKAPGQLMP